MDPNQIQQQLNNQRNQNPKKQQQEQ